MQRRKLGILGVSGIFLLTVVAVSVGWLLDKSSEDGCYGFAKMSRVAEVLGSSNLKSEQGGAVPSLEPGSMEYCKISVPGTGITVQAYFDRGSADPKLLTKLDRYDTDASREHATPVGNGWRGVINAGPVFMRSAVWLPCSSRPSDGMTVSVVAHSPSVFESLEDLERRKFARLATSIAKSAGAEWGCEEGLGERVDSLPAGFTDGVSAGLVSQGTCEGVKPPSFGTAAVPEAPVEDCIVVDEQDKPQFRLAAYYGPFVEAARHDTFRSDRYSGKQSGGRAGFYWLSGECSNGPALYSVETLDSEDGASIRKPALQKAALDVFAQRSAEARGCTLVR
jgi:hypothetical protein